MATFCAADARGTGACPECERGPIELERGCAYGAVPARVRRWNFTFPAISPSRISRRRGDFIEKLPDRERRLNDRADSERRFRRAWEAALAHRVGAIYMRPRSFRSANEKALHSVRADIAPAGPDSSRKITVSISMPAL